MIKKTSRFLALAAIFLIPIFPLIVANSLFFPFITGKAFYFRILVEIATAGWLVLAFLDAKYRPKWTPLTIGIGLFALITLAADLLGVNPLRSLWSNFERMEGWITIIHLFALFLVTTNIFGSGEEGRRMWHRFMNMELAVAFLVAVYGLLQLFGWTAIHQGSTRIDASLGNAAYMAVYMLWNAGLAAYLFFVAKAKQIGNSGFLKWAYPVLAVLFAFEVFETSTRGTILGLVGGILLSLFLYAVLGKGQSQRSRRLAVGAIVLVILACATFWFNRNRPFIQNNEILQRLSAISWEDNKTQARAYIWPMALKGASQRPILGWGQENFNYIFNADYNPLMWHQEQWFDRAHSVFLDWLVASGVIGFLSYISLYLLFLYALWKSSLSLAEKAVFTGLLAAYAMHNIFVFDNLASYFLFFIALGFVDSLRGGKPIFSPSERALSPEAIEYVVLPSMIVLLVFVAYFFDVRPIKANTRLITALQNCSNQPTPALFERALAVDTYVANQEIREQYLSCAGGVISNPQIPAAVKQSYFEFANQSINDQIAATPLKDTRIYALAGSFMNSINQSNQAVDLLETAYRLSPTKQSIILPLAVGFINAGRTSEAIEMLKAAYESSPDHDLIQSTYVVALIAAGKESVARQLFADKPGVFATVQVAQAYMIAKEYAKAIPIYKSILAANPDDANATIQLAQAQYAAGQVSAAIATLRSLEKSHPEYKEQVEASIKQIQK